MLDLVQHFKNSNTIMPGGETYSRLHEPWRIISCFLYVSVTFFHDILETVCSSVLGWSYDGREQLTYKGWWCPKCRSHISSNPRQWVSSCSQRCHHWRLELTSWGGRRWPRRWCSWRKWRRLCGTWWRVGCWSRGSLMILDKSWKCNKERWKYLHSKEPII